MTFDEIMERSGLDPHKYETTFLISIDDLNLEGLTCRDLVQVRAEISLEFRALDAKADAAPNTESLEEMLFDPRVINRLRFSGLLWQRVREPGMNRLMTEPASRLQRKRRARDCN